MRLDVYTDGRSKSLEIDGVRTDIGSSSSIILTDKIFIGSTLSKDMKDVVSTKAELIAIQDALKYISDNKIVCDEIYIHTDNLAIVTTYKQMINKLNKKACFYEVWRNIFNYRRKYKLKIFHIYSHQSKLNPNKICDYMVRYM